MPTKLFQIVGVLGSLLFVVIIVGSLTHQFDGLTSWVSRFPQGATSSANSISHDTAATSSQRTTTSSTVETNAFVVRVLDGDTLSAVLNGESAEVTVRLLGINTPETVDPRRPVECFGKEASARVRELLEGRRVRLDADLQADERDKYGRLLRNVTTQDGTDINALLIQEGYAYAYLSFPMNSDRKRELKQLEERAKLEGRGLWSSGACPENADS